MYTPPTLEELVAAYEQHDFSSHTARMKDVHEFICAHAHKYNHTHPGESTINFNAANQFRPNVDVYQITVGCKGCGNTLQWRTYTPGNFKALIRCEYCRLETTYEGVI